MSKRTPQGELENWDDLNYLDEIVVDKREGKRAGKAKAQRRNRRYENRILRSTTIEDLFDQEDTE